MERRFTHRILGPVALALTCAFPASAAPLSLPAELRGLDVVPFLVSGPRQTPGARTGLTGLGVNGVARALPSKAPGFYETFLAPELSRSTEDHAYFVGSPAYGLQRDASSAAHFATVEGIEHDTVRAVRRATRDWLLEEVGIDRLAITFRPVTEALDRVDSRLNPNEGSATTIRLGFSHLFPRLVVDRTTAVGDFRFRATLDGSAGADFRPSSRHAPWLGTDVDFRERSARFRLGLSF